MASKREWLEEAKWMYGTTGFYIECDGLAGPKYILGSCDVPRKLWGTSDVSPEEAAAWGYAALRDNPEYGIGLDGRITWLANG